MSYDGLVPSLLFFDILPSFPCSNTKAVFQIERLNALKTALPEMKIFVAGNHIQRALHSNIPPATKYLVKPGYKVRIFRDESREWEGQFTVAKTSIKIMSITCGNSTT